MYRDNCNVHAGTTKAGKPEYWFSRSAGGERGTERGAHLLLQVRTQVLNDDLRATFERWYPSLKAESM